MPPKVGLNRRDDQIKFSPQNLSFSSLGGKTAPDVLNTEGAVRPVTEAVRPPPPSKPANN
jgi:hypothetical protein